MGIKGGQAGTGAAAFVTSLYSDFTFWDFPGGPVVKTLHFECRGHRFDPWAEN